MLAKPALRALLFVCLAGACVPAAPQAEPPTEVVEPATPTPEIFIPLNPSPTPSGSTLPMSCQVTDLNVYVSAAGGYCFAYPAGFELDEGAVETGGITVLGPALDQSPEPVRASLGVTLLPVTAESDLARLVDAYLAQAGLRDLPQPIERSARMIGGEPAEVLTGVPGRLSTTVILAVHGDHLLVLSFGPSDAAAARADFDALFQTVTGSFAFTA